MITKEQLKINRLDLGLTLEQMASRLKFPHGTYLKYEYGTRALPDDIEWRMALAHKDPITIVELLLAQTNIYGWDKMQVRNIAKILLSQEECCL